MWALPLSRISVQLPPFGVVWFPPVALCIPSVYMAQPIATSEYLFQGMAPGAASGMRTVSLAYAKGVCQALFRAQGVLENILNFAGKYFVLAKMRVFYACECTLCVQVMEFLTCQELRTAPISGGWRAMERKLSGARDETNRLDWRVAHYWRSTRVLYKKDVRAIILSAFLSEQSDGAVALLTLHPGRR